MCLVHELSLVLLTLYMDSGMHGFRCGLYLTKSDYLGTISNFFCILGLMGFRVTFSYCLHCAHKVCKFVLYLMDSIIR